MDQSIEMDTEGIIKDDHLQIEKVDYLIGAGWD